MSNRGRRGGGAAAMYAARMTDEIEVKDEDNIGLNLAAAEDEPEPQVEVEDDGYEDEPEPEPQIDTSHEEDGGGEQHAEEPDPVADLQRQLAEMRAEREAEKAERATADESAELRQHQAAIANGHRNAKAALGNAKAAFAAASRAGDWDAAAEAQADIAQITADIREFEVASDELAAAAKRKPAAKPAANADPFEAAIADRSDKTKAWLRKNKADLLKSPARGMRAQAADAEARDLGIELDTPEYFAHMDKSMGYQVAKQPQKQAKPTGRPRVAAPGGGNSGGAQGAGDLRDVRLSRDEAAMARAMFPGDPKALGRYAAQKAEIIKNGRNPQRGGPVYTAQQPGARR